MAEKKLQRYQLTLTDTTAKLVYALQKYGHNIRDILNAGIVLYDQSDNPTRAMAEMRANCKIDEEIAQLTKRLAAVIKEKTQYVVGASKGPGSIDEIKKALGPDDAALAEKLIADALKDEAAASKKKRGKASKSA